MKTLNTILFCVLFTNIYVFGQSYFFSVNDSVRVVFSPGNLQYNAAEGTHECADGTTKQGTWRFAPNQYDTIGEANKNKAVDYAGWTDLFVYASSGYSIENSPNLKTDEGNPITLDNITGTYYDWGKYNSIIGVTNYEEPNIWRTLSLNEWLYILSTQRTDLGVKKCSVKGIQGYMLIPDYDCWWCQKYDDGDSNEGDNFVNPWDDLDDWDDDPDENNVGVGNDGYLNDFFGENGYLSDFQNLTEYDEETWGILESKGAIFIPYAGMLENSDYTKETVAIWTATAHGYFTSLDVVYSEGGLYYSTNNDGVSTSVRLVRDYQYKVNTSVNNTDIGSVTLNNDDGWYDVGATAEITATAKEGAKFIRWSDGNSDNPRSISVTEPYSYTAEFGYGFDVMDIQDITINEEETLSSINISEYCVSDDDVSYSYMVRSSNMGVVYPVVFGNTLEFIQYGTGTSTISLYVTVGESTIMKSFNVTINTKNPPQDCNLSISAKVNDVSCFGKTDGNIELSVSGGEEPYQYKWSTGRTSNGIYNIGAGEYFVLVSDENGCTVIEDFTIEEPTSVKVSGKITKPACGETDGKIELSVTGGTAPYSYVWKMPNGTSNTSQNLENVSVNIYEVTVTDDNYCQTTKTISVAESEAPSLKVTKIISSKCNEATGGVELEISSGTEPYSYEWNDSVIVSNNLYRPKLYAGEYKLRVVDSKNCTSMLSVQVPLIPLRQPKLALVSYDDTLKHNIVVWQKENTDDIDQYYIYREIDSLGNYDKIDSLNYSEISVYVDETAQHKKQAYRYEISAMNSCMESPVSKEFKTINLQRKVEDDGAVQLWWNAYEGCEYVSYSLYRVTENGSEFMLNLPANKFKYTDEQPKEGTIGYYILIHLSEKIDVSQLLKAQNEPSAYDYIISTIAYIRNDIEKESIGILSCNAVVYSKDKSIIISNAVGNNVFVFDVEGKLVAQRQNVDSVEIPVQTAGVYVVIVGKNVFKVMVN